MEIGTWYFDTWARCYVQVVAGAQAEGYVTVAGYQPTAMVAIPVKHLDLNRKVRLQP
jgi:hypothetical protein